jgi:hypothetical protein
MPFDPSKPENDSPLVSAEMRAQLTGLKDLIDAVPAGPQGPPGEVSAQQLVDERINHARNPTSLFPLGLVVSDPPTQAEMQALATRLDELLVALQRQP